MCSRSFYNDPPLELDLITFLSYAWRQSRVREWEGDTDGEAVGVGEEMFASGYESKGDTSLVKGANGQWPTDWMNLIVNALFNL